MIDDLARLAASGRTEPRDGFEWRVYVDDDWQMVTPETARACSYWQAHRDRPVPAVARFQRGRYDYTRHERTSAWYSYCADHLYGRWIEDGRVLEFRLAPVDRPEGELFVRRVPR